MEEKNTLSNLKDSVKANLYTRATSPLYGTYLLAFLLYHWKATIIVLFEPYKLNQLEVYFGQQSFWGTIGWPFGIALLNICIIPFFERWAYWVFLKFRAGRQKLKQEHNQEVYQKIKKEIYDHELNTMQLCLTAYEYLIEDKIHNYQSYNLDSINELIIQEDQKKLSNESLKSIIVDLTQKGYLTASPIQWTKKGKDLIEFYGTIINKTF